MCLLELVIKSHEAELVLAAMTLFLAPQLFVL